MNKYLETINNKKISCKEIKDIFNSYLREPKIENLIYLKDNSFDLYQLDYYLIRQSSVIGSLETLFFLLENIKKPFEDIKEVLNWCLKNAIIHNNEEITYYLLNLEVVNPRMDNNFPIRAAAKQNNEKLLKYLLQNKNVVLTTKTNATIRSIVRNNNKELLVYVLNYAENDLNLNEKEISSMIQEVFIESCEIENYKLLDFALEHPQFSARKKNNQALRLATKRNKIELIDYILTKGLNHQKELLSSMIRIACENGHFKLFKLLTLKFKGYQFGRQGANLNLVIENNNTDFSLYLLNFKEFNPERNKNYALKKAIHNENRKIILELLKNKNVIENINDDFYKSFNEEAQRKLKAFKIMMNLNKF